MPLYSSALIYLAIAAISEYFSLCQLISVIRIKSQEDRSGRMRQVYGCIEEARARNLRYVSLGVPEGGGKAHLHGPCLQIQPLHCGEST